MDDVKLIMNNPSTTIRSYQQKHQNNESDPEKRIKVFGK